MKHGSNKKTLNMSSSHRQAVYKNLTICFIKNGFVNTTLAKSKVLARKVEKLITIAKNSDTLETKRMLISRLDKDSQVKLYEIAEKTKNRNGGYTRITKTWIRYGDGASTAKVELVD